MIGIGKFLSSVRSKGNPSPPPFDPSLLDYQALWITKGKTNSDVEKNVPNLIDPSNPLVCSNFIWTDESGYTSNGLKFDGVDDIFTSKALPVTTKYTVVGDVTLLKDGTNGISKLGNWAWWKNNLYLNTSTVSNNVADVIGFTSEALIITKNSSMIGNIGADPSMSAVVNSRYNPEMIFSSLAVIPSVLTEEEIRSVYEYIKTLTINSVL